jgi:hypothetical protein
MTIPACQAIEVSGRSGGHRPCQAAYSGPIVLPMTRWAMAVASGAIPIQIIAEPWAPGASVTDVGYAMV